MRDTFSGFAQLATATFRHASYPTNGQRAFCQRRLDKEKVLFAYDTAHDGTIIEEVGVAHRE
jgi:hypothetical protein